MFLFYHTSALFREAVYSSFLTKISSQIGEKSNKELLALPPSKDVDVTTNLGNNKSHVHFAFAPDRQKQQDGLRGQMVVLYDVQRALDGGELLVKYFAFCSGK